MHDVLSVPSTSLEQLRHEVDRLHLLHAIGLEFAASLDLDELPRLVLERMRSAVEAGAGTVWLAEGDGMLRCRAGAGEIGDRLLGALRPWAEVASGQVAGTSADATRTVPLVVGDESVGVIQLSGRATPAGDFTPNDVELLEAIAPLAAIALRNARVHAAARRAEDIALVL